MKHQRKLYVTINSQLIRVDNIDSFQKYFIKTEALNNHFKAEMLEVINGKKKRANPFIFEVEQDEMSLLEKEIKSKISSKDKSIMTFTSISIKLDSNHYPLIKIVPVNREEEIQEQQCQE
jgi:hypothetical protein